MEGMSNMAGPRHRLRRTADRFDSVDPREFLPAALEVIQTPPSPTGRLLGVIVILFFAVAVAWAFFGRVDELATAPGRIVPAGEVKVIQPLDSGVVRAIRVQDGDHVRAGQLLVELDPTQTGADRDRLVSDLAQAKLDVARLTALSAAIASGRPPQLVVPPDVPAALVAEARASMLAQYDQQAAKVADLASQISQKQAEAEEVGARSEQISASMPMLADKVRIHSELRRQGYGTSLSYLDAQQQLSDARHELGVQTARATESQDAKTALERQREGVQSQFAADILGDLRKAQQQQNELTQELVKAQNKSAQTELRSPIDGVVDQLAVHTLNGVVTPAEQLMIVVPDSRDLTIEARLEDRDVGFVHTGQPVKVKVETFNFTRYGLLDGRVVDVSRDVINADSRRTGDPAMPTATGRPAAPSYVARIALAKTSLMIDGHEEPLQPGMSITAEIKTGDRTIIDYLLSPLARRTSESLHER
jgi:hemolysin D